MKITYGNLELEVISTRQLVRCPVYSDTTGDLIGEEWSLQVTVQPPQFDPPSTRRPPCLPADPDRQG